MPGLVVVRGDYQTARSGERQLAQCSEPGVWKASAAVNSRYASAIRGGLVLLVSCLFAFATTMHQASAQETNAILEACGQAKSIKKLQQLFVDDSVSSAVKVLTTTPAAKRDRIAEKLRTLLKPETLVLNYQREFAALGAKESQEIYQWCLSPIGRKIIAIEERDSEDDDPADITGRALASIRNARNPDARRNNLKQFIQLSHLSETMPESIAVVATLHLAAEDLGKPDDQRLSRASFLETLVNLGRDLQRDFTPLFEAIIVDSHSELSDDELAAYVRFLQSGAGKAWAEADYYALHGYFSSTVRSIFDGVAPER
jgi:hypothetical protein